MTFVAAKRVCYAADDAAHCNSPIRLRRSGRATGSRYAPETSVVTLLTRESPMGTLHFDLPAERLRVDDKGGLVVGLKVSQPETARDWRITDMQLELTGTALER